jgi:hypothetical protein
MSAPIHNIFNSVFKKINTIFYLFITVARRSKSTIVFHTLRCGEVNFLSVGFIIMRVVYS